MKICAVGARKALSNHFKEKGAINNSGKVIDPNKLLIVNNDLKSIMFQKYGITREIIIPDTKADYIQFKSETLGELDAINGIYYKGNEKYQTDFTDDNTLRPDQLVRKYVEVSNDELGFKLNTSTLSLNSENVNKFKIGLFNTYPHLDILTSNSSLKFPDHYNIYLVKRENVEARITSKDIIGNTEYLANTEEQEGIEQVIKPLLTKFKGVSIKWIEKEEMDELLTKHPKILITNGVDINAVAIDKEVFLVRGKVTSDTALEELMHMFTDTLKLERKALYVGLLNQAKKAYPGMVVQVNEDYSNKKGFTQEDRDAEIITRGLRDAYKAERDVRPEGIDKQDFFKLVKEFFGWMIQKFKDLFDIDFSDVHGNVTKLHIHATLGQVASYLNVNDVMIQDLRTDTPRFNTASTIPEDFEQNILDEKRAADRKKEVKEIKIERITTQITRLKKLHKKYAKQKGYDKVVTTLELLIENGEQYKRDVLEDDVPTVSITKFVGSPVFTGKVSESLLKFQHFGTFIHLFMEELQFKALETGLTPLQIINKDPEYFNKFYDANIDLITIPGVDNNRDTKVLSKITKETLIKDLINVVGIVNEPFMKGEIVIPEITIYGIDSMDRVVDGRLDYLIIRMDGTTSIKDFKTTKSNSVLTRYSQHLINTRYPTRALEEGVHPAFERFQGKSKASGFLSQVGGYKRLLAQMGITSRGDSIINIIYGPDKYQHESGDEDQWVYGNMFVSEIFMEGEHGVSLETDENGTVLAEISPIYKRILTALSSSLPVEGETESDVIAKAEADINYISHLSPEKMKIITENLKGKIETQLKQIEVEIAELSTNRADDVKLKEAKERRQLLRDTRNWFDRTFIEAGEIKELPPELILKGVLDKTREIVKNLRDNSENIYKNNDISNAIGILSIRNKQFDDLKSFLQAFKQALLATETINENSPVVREIEESITTAEKGQSFYIDLAGQQFEKIMLKLPKKNVEEMMGQMELLFEMDIKKLERIISGDITVFDKGNHWLGGKIKRLISKTSGKPFVITDDIKEEAASKLKKINTFLANKTFDRDFVKLYVENTFQNPESGFYIGSTISQGFGSLTGDDFRAAYGNSELAITAMANYAVMLTQDANMRFFDRMEALKVGKVVNTFTKKFGSYQAANEAISEKVMLLNSETGEEEEYMSFRGPVDPEFRKKIDEFDKSLKEISKRIKDLKDDNKLTDDEKKIKKKILNDEMSVKKSEYVDWLIENSETKLIPEVYKLEVSLPPAILEKIELINLEISSIKARANNQDWNLDETSRLEIKQHEFDIAMLKKEAAKDNPDLIDIYEKINQYYEYHVNEGGYNYARNQVLKQYSENSVEYKAWLEANSDLIPDPEWEKEYYELSNQKKELNNQDDILDELFAARKELIGKYKFKSMFGSRSLFNPLYMEEDDYVSLIEIEENISHRFEQLSQSKGNALVGDDRKKMQDLNAQIARMKQVQNKPSYQKELDERINEIMQIYSLITNEQDPVKKEQLETQLHTKDVIFKTWYDRNNTVKYKLGTIVSGGKIDSAPLSFNTMIIPTDPSRMIRVPNSKYRTRSYKEAAYNPKYTASVERKTFGSGSYPMPKGIVHNKTTGRFEIQKDAMWVNPKFTEMIKDKFVEDFFNTYVMDEYYNKQIDMSATKLGFIYPGDTQSAFDTLRTEGIEGLRREGREWVSNNVLLGNSELEKASNIYGISGQARVRFSHNYKLPASIGTKDGLNAIMKWGMQYEIYQAMEEAALVVSPSIDFLKSIKSQVSDPIIQKQIDKVIDLFEFEKNKFIYGKQFNAPDNKKAALAGRKLFRQFTTAISWGRLSFDYALQGGNLVSGNIQMFLATQSKNDNGFGTWKDWGFAKLQMYGREGFMYNVIGDWGKVDDVSLSTKILRYFNPSLKSMEEILDVANRGTMIRILNKGFNIGDMAYVLQDKGEMEIAMSTMLKNLSAHKYYQYELNPDGISLKLDENGSPIIKLDSTGNMIQLSAYDSLVDNGSGTPSIRIDSSMTLSDLEGIRGRTHQEYIMHQGNYSNQSQTRIESSIMGVLMMFFRKYLEPFIEARFKNAFGVGDPRNWVAGQAQVGWWVGFYRIFSELGLQQGLLATLPGFVAEKTGKIKYNRLYAAKAAQVRRELLFASIATFVYISLRALRFGDDDERKELSWAEMQGMRLIAKVTNESRSMVYVPYIGKGDEFINNFGTFTSAFNEGKTVFKLAENFGYAMSYELFDSEYAHTKGYYQKDAFRYEKGDPKVMANFLALTGVENILDVINPEFAVAKQFIKSD